MSYKGFRTHWTKKLSPVQMLLMFYLLAVILSTITLTLPVAHQEGVELAFIDVLFTAVSALSVTGLSTLSIIDSFSTVGIIFLTIILQLGAVGEIGRWSCKDRW